MDSKFVLVEKEEVASFHFPQEEVVMSEKESKLLRKEMERAITLGNLEHYKVKIYFEDDSNKKVVNTTIWAVTDHSIVLKQNVVIPIRRIYKLEI